MIRGFEAENTKILEYSIDFKTSHYLWIIMTAVGFSKISVAF